MDHVGVGDVLLLRGVGHQQVVAHQPFDLRGVALGQPVRRAERARVVGAELGVVAAAPLGDVVEQAGKQ